MKNITLYMLWSHQRKHIKNKEEKFGYFKEYEHKQDRYFNQS